MSDEQQFIVTVDYGKYAYKYLFITNVIPYPDWFDDDDRWLTYDERKVVRERFEQWADKHIGGLTGKIVLIEPSDLVVANAKDQRNDLLVKSRDSDTERANAPQTPTIIGDTK